MNLQTDRAEFCAVPVNPDAETIIIDPPLGPPPDVSLLLVVSGYSGASVLYIFVQGERTRWLIGTEKRLREIAANDYAGVSLEESASAAETAAATP